MKINLKIVPIVLLFLFNTIAFVSATSSNSFKTVLYTGTGAMKQITGVGFKPDLVWIKQRSGNWSHYLIDSVRSETKLLNSDLDYPESTNSDFIKSFDPDGFTLGTDAGINTNGSDYVAWCWNAGGVSNPNTDGTIQSTVMANPEAGFSIVKYNGTGVTSTVGHGLSKIPKCIIIKRLNGITSWAVYHSGVGNIGVLNLNSAAKKEVNSLYWENTSPGETTFTIGASGGVTNILGGEYIAYCWADIPGQSAFGSYVGNGLANGPTIDCGFKPEWLMIKNISSNGTDWVLMDSKRDISNPVTLYLKANNSNSEASAFEEIDFQPNGFQAIVDSWNINRTNETYIYTAFGGFNHQGNMTINGNVGIGKLNPTEALEVNGTVKAKEVVVTLDGWADYVFNTDYNLSDLDQIEAFIEKNHHLPGIPSAENLKSKGISVSQMLELQMKKIEELTLYLIKQNKENQDIREELNLVRQQLKEMNK